MRDRLPLYAGLLLALATVVTFLPVTGHGFVRFDDTLYVTENPRVQAGLSWDGLLWALRANVASNWHPLTLLSHMLDVELFGLDPRGHHLTSLLLHSLNTVLLFAVLRRMTGSTARSAAVAALFGLHPTHVESVAWVAERKDVLSGLFWILAMGAWHRYTLAPSRRRYGAVALLLALGLLAKPMVVTLPFVLVLLDVWPLGRVRLDAGWPTLRGDLLLRLREKIPLFALVAVSSAVTVAAQSGALASAEAFPLARRLANAVRSYGVYLVQTAAPRNLAVFYPAPATAAEVPAGEVAGAAVLLAALTLLALRLARRAPYVPVGWLWYLGTLVPVIGLVQVGSQAHADRYTYLPTIGLFLAAAWGLPELLGLGEGRRRKAAVAATAGATLAALLALAVGTRLQLRHWVDTEALFRRALAVTEGNYLAHLNLGQLLATRGDREEALEHFRAALALRPGMYQIHAGLGNALRRSGRPAEALPHLRHAVKIQPRNPRLRHGLAMALEELGRLEEAIAELRAAVELDPGFADAHHGLAVLLERQGDEAGALRHYLAALAADPGRTGLYPPAGTLLARQGRLAEAAGLFAEAVRRQPGSAAAHYNLALTLEALGRGEEARRHHERARELGLSGGPP